LERKKCGDNTKEFSLKRDKYIKTHESYRHGEKIVFLIYTCYTRVPEVCKCASVGSTVFEKIKAGIFLNQRNTRIIP
jgi:hypothetical protein